MIRPCPKCGGTRVTHCSSLRCAADHEGHPCASCRGTGVEPLRDVTGPSDDELEADRYRTALSHVDQAAARGLLLRNPAEALGTIRSLVKRALENL